MKTADEQMRVKIAEACGWVQTVPLGHPPCCWKSPDGVSRRRIPDYLNDLNACREFERTLSGPIVYEYGGCLTRLCRNDAAMTEAEESYERGSVAWHSFHASARQRCEAFLRVKGLLD